VRAIAAAAMAVGLGPYCVNGNFDPQVLVNGVRVMVVRADKPYAPPGAEVNLEVLVADGRADKPRPLEVYWLPFRCDNPRDDLYYACFSSLLPNSGPKTGTGARPPVPDWLKPGADVTGFLPKGTKYKVTLPPDIISSHPQTAGSDQPYGLSIVFFIACAGHVRIADVDTSQQSQQLIPLSCTDDDGNALGPDQWIFSFARVYAFETLANQNPVIESLTLTQPDGTSQPVDLAAGITVAPCATPPTASSGCGARKKSCAGPKLSINVPESSWESRPPPKDGPNDERHELLYSSYYYTPEVGSFDGEGTILYDAVKGKVANEGLAIIPPGEPGEGHAWIIVQDNRNGTTWVDLPVHVK
jgi:hypothetical protein